MSNIEDNKLAVFQGKHIRKLFHEGEWWFSIIDVIEVLTESSIPKRYWSDLKRKLPKEGFSEAYEKIVQLKMLTPETTKITKDRNSKGFTPLKKDAQDGGAVAGRTRKDIERQTGKPVVSSKNYKELPQPRKKKLK